MSAIVITALPVTADADTTRGATFATATVVVADVLVAVVVVVTAVGSNSQRNPRTLVCTHTNPRPDTPSSALAPTRTHTEPRAATALASTTPLSATTPTNTAPHNNHQRRNLNTATPLRKNNLTKSPHSSHVIRLVLGLVGLTANICGEILVPRFQGVKLRRTPIVVSRNTTNCGSTDVQLVQFVF